MRADVMWHQCKYIAHWQQQIDANVPIDCDLTKVIQYTYVLMLLRVWWQLTATLSPRC